MTRLAALLAASLVFIACTQAADQPQEPSAAPERLLHGDWKGGACLGDWTFKADGSYDLRHYTPGNNHLTGTWKVRWDALPPTLVLTCKTSDDADLVGKTWEVKVVQLDKEVFIYEHSGGPPLRCTREPNAEDKELSALQGTWTPLQYEERGQTIEGDGRHVLRHIFQGSKVIVRLDGETVAEGKIVVDATQNPKHLDLQFPSGQSHSLIYVRAGDYIIYSGNRNATRPIEFATGTANGGEYLMAWKIEK